MGQVFGLSSGGDFLIGIRVVFGHYKAGAQPELISHYHSTKASVILKIDFRLELWSQGMSVMLEKVSGCSADVSRL